MRVGLVDITAKRAALTPRRVALIEAQDGRTLTYAALEDRAARAAAVLAQLGVARGDRVAILCRNRIAFFELLFGCAKLGAILAPLNWRAPVEELAPILADCTPKALFFGCEDAETAHQLACDGVVELVALDAPTEGAHYETLMAQARPAYTDASWDADATWMLIYTSGTTGAAKAVIQTFQMSAVNAFHIMQAFGVGEVTRTLNFLPLFHTAGIQLVTLPTLMAGGCVTILPGFDLNRAIEILPELDVFFGVPAVYQQLALDPRFDALDLSRVRAWGCGGAPLPDVLVERYAAKGVIVQNGYGMTETGPTAFVASREDAAVSIGSVGRPQMLIEARIVGSDGADVAEGEAGEIWMRGPGVTPGYWNRPEETARAFTADGWLKSGDLGRRDGDGAYYVVGRSKDMFISGGENVYPAEIENVLARHPAVLEAAVIGVADENWGEVGHAFIELRPGAPAPAPADLIQFCRASIAGYKIPRRFTFADGFPRTAAGKIKKHLLAGAPETPLRRREG